MHMNHASHALLKIQYVHASNLGFKKFILFSVSEGEHQKHKDGK